MPSANMPSAIYITTSKVEYDDIFSYDVIKQKTNNTLVCKFDDNKGEIIEEHASVSWPHAFICKNSIYYHYMIFIFVFCGK